MRFSTPRRRPFVIDENTTIGELSKDDRTAAIIQQVLAQAGNALTGDFWRDEAVVCAYTAVFVIAAVLAFRYKARHDAA